jgi:uncharacterized protein (TIGR00661 family)
MPYDIKYKFHGLSFEYSKSGSINWYKTISNLGIIRLLKDIKLDIEIYDKIVTDFDPITAWASRISKKESIGISHQYSFLSKSIPRAYDSKVNNFIINNIAPVDIPIGLHFKKYDSFIDYPVIRGDIKLLTPQDKGYYTVYLPSYNASIIVEELSKYPFKFEIFTKDVTKVVKYKNMKIRPSSKSKFAESFVNCKGIITSSGFETPSEALFLKKKILSIPIKGQYEQMCNAEALRLMGVFVSKDLSNIINFFTNDETIDYKWVDPMPSIINVILKS